MQATRLFDFIYYQQLNYPQDKSLGGRGEDGQWHFYSTDEVITTAEKMAGGLLNLGLNPGDRISLVSYQNRPEWAIIDLAAQLIGVITVPLYPTISPREYAFILNDAEVKYVFVGKDDLYEKVAQAKHEVPSLQEIYTMDRQPDHKYWEDLCDESRVEEAKSRAEAIKSDQLATFIYTSGTTGNPKGVMLTHENLAHIVVAVSELLPRTTGYDVLSFLPMCHVFERSVAYFYMYQGANVYFTGTGNLGGDEGDLKSVKPHMFTTVPRLLEKVYEAIYNKGLALSGVSRKLFFWALDMTDDYEYGKKYSGLSAVKRNLADKLIFSKWREALGGNVQLIVTGAAACPAKIAKVFSAAGIPIREGYGLTEASPTLSVNLLDEAGALLGSVGPAIPGVELKIDDTEGDYRAGEGEILAKGPNIMQGYWNNPAATEKVFKYINGEKWLRTGDVGTLVSKGNHMFLKITDRKKELLKTSGGKYVAPAPIENRFKEDFLVEQVMVVGEKQKFVSALIVPAEVALQDWCKSEGIEFTDLVTAVKDPRVIAKYQAVVDSINPEFSHVEQIKQFTLVPNTWEATRTDGTDAELTPTLKLKRRVISAKYQQEIAGMYGETIASTVQ